MKETTSINKLTLQYMAMINLYTKILKLINKLKPARYATRVEIIVQDRDEVGIEFAIRIDETIKQITNDFGNKVLGIQFTSAQDGRQTCNIAYQVKL